MVILPIINPFVRRSIRMMECNQFDYDVSLAEGISETMPAHINILTIVIQQIKL